MNVLQETVKRLLTGLVSKSSF